MATIQVRDIPEDVYETIKRGAEAAGQSLQAFMRERLVEIAARDRRRELLRAWGEHLEANPNGVTREDILADLDADRR